MLLPGSGHRQMGHMTVTVIIWISQTYALYLRGIGHKTIFFVTLRLLESKDENNHFGSVRLQKEIIKYLSATKMQRMVGIYKFWYFAVYTVHLNSVEKS